MNQLLGSKKMWLLAAVLLSALLSSFAGSFNGYIFQIILFVGINIVLAVSLNLINGYTGQFSLGHAGFMAVGAYMAAIVTLGIPLPLLTYFEPSGSLLLRGAQYLILGLYHVLNVGLGVANWSIAVVHGLPPVLQFLVALICGGVLAALAGFLVGVPSLRLRGDYLAIVTLGFGEIIRVIIQNTDAIGGARGYSGVPYYTTLFWAYGIAAFTVYVIVSLVDSTYGRGFLTVRDDEVAAEAMGINTTRYKVTAFVVGAFFAGVAGGLYAHTTTYINPAGFDFQRSIEIVVIVILGGMGNTGGVFCAAILLTVLGEMLRFVPPVMHQLIDFVTHRLPFQSIWLPHVPVSVREFIHQAIEWVIGACTNRTIIYSILLIALMLSRPQGLFGGMRAFGPRPTRPLPKAA